MNLITQNSLVQKIKKFTKKYEQQLIGGFKILVNFTEVSANCYLLSIFDPQGQKSSSEGDVRKYEYYQFPYQWIKYSITLYWLLDIARMIYCQRHCLKKFSVLLVIGTGVFDLLILNDISAQTILSIFFEETNVGSENTISSKYQNTIAPHIERNLSSNNSSQVSTISAEKFAWAPVIYICRLVKIISIVSNFRKDFKQFRSSQCTVEFVKEIDYQKEQANNNNKDLKNSLKGKYNENQEVRTKSYSKKFQKKKNSQSQIQQQAINNNKEQGKQFIDTNIPNTNNNINNSNVLQQQQNVNKKQNIQKKQNKQIQQKEDQQKQQFLDNSRIQKNNEILNNTYEKNNENQIDNLKLSNNSINNNKNRNFEKKLVSDNQKEKYQQQQNQVRNKNNKNKKNSINNINNQPPSNQISRQISELTTPIQSRRSSQSHRSNTININNNNCIYQQKKQVNNNNKQEKYLSQSHSVIQNPENIEETTKRCKAQTQYIQKSCSTTNTPKPYTIQKINRAPQLSKKRLYKNSKDLSTTSNDEDIKKNFNNNNKYYEKSNFQQKTNTTPSTGKKHGFYRSKDKNNNNNINNQNNNNINNGQSLQKRNSLISNMSFEDSQNLLSKLAPNNCWGYSNSKVFYQEDATTAFFSSSENELQQGSKYFLNQSEQRNGSEYTSFKLSTESPSQMSTDHQYQGDLEDIEETQDSSNSLKQQKQEQQQSNSLLEDTYCNFEQIKDEDSEEYEQEIVYPKKSQDIDISIEFKLSLDDQELDIKLDNFSQFDSSIDKVCKENEVDDVMLNLTKMMIIQQLQQREELKILEQQLNSKLDEYIEVYREHKELLSLDL